MAIDKKLIFWNKQSNFSAPTDSLDTSGSVKWHSIVFFKDTGKIWTHGTFYGGLYGTADAQKVPLTVGTTLKNLSIDGHTHSYLGLGGGILTGALKIYNNSWGAKDTDYNVFSLTPPTHTGGPWHHVLRDDATKAYYYLSYNTTKVFSIDSSGVTSVTGRFTGKQLVSTDNIYLPTGYFLYFDYGVSNNFYIRKNGANLNYSAVNGVHSFDQNVSSTGFVKTSSSDSYVLLGAGGHKLISDFALAANYLPLSGGTMTTGAKVTIPSSTSGIYGGAFEIRERDLVSNNQSSWDYAPRITFHWANRYGRGFGLRSDGQFAVDDVPISLSTHTHSTGTFTMASIGEKIYNVTRCLFTNTPTEILIKTGIPFISSSHMPVIHIEGYAYGLTSPVELKIGYYVYGGAHGWCGAVSMGAWRPTIKLFTYIGDDAVTKYTGIALVGSIYYPQFSVHVQTEMGGNYTTGWSITANGADNTVYYMPNTDVVTVPYKSTFSSNINGVEYNGVSNITIKASTTNILTRGSYLTGSNFDGSAATTWAVDATSANTASKVVARDGSGNFSAGTISASLSGNATTATTATNLSGGTISATTGSFSGAVTFNSDILIPKTNAWGYIKNPNALGGIKIGTGNSSGVYTDALSISVAGNYVRSEIPLIANSSLSVTGKTTIKKDLGANLADWVASQHNGAFEVGRSTNAMCVAIGVTDDNVGYIQTKGNGITTPGNLSLLPGGGTVTIGSPGNANLAVTGNINAVNVALTGQITGATTIFGDRFTAKNNGILNNIYTTDPSGNATLTIQGGNFTHSVFFKDSYNTSAYATLSGGYVGNGQLSLNKYSAQNTISNTSTYRADGATISGVVEATSFTGSLTGNANTASKASQITVGSCATAQATAAKAVTLTNYTLEAGAKAIIKFTYASVASSTLNINSTGAKNLYYNGALTTASTWAAGDIAEVQYDGTQFHILYVNTDNATTKPTLAGDVTGNSATASAVAWGGITGKPTTLSGYSITDSLFATQVSVAQTDDTWVKGYTATKKQALIYNTSGVEWGYLFNFNSNDNYGTVLATSYSNNTLKMLSKSSGVWSTWVTFMHSGNSNLSTVDWTAKNLSLNGTITGATTVNANVYNLTPATGGVLQSNGTNILRVSGTKDIVLSTPIAANIYFRPGGDIETVGQMILSSAGNVTVAGSLSVGAITSTGNVTASNLWGIASKNISLTLTTSWQDTGILMNDATLFASGSGTYIIELYSNTSGVSSQYDIRYSGIMAVFTSQTNSTDTDEITLHSMGNASNDRHIYLRTMLQVTPNYAKIQIASSAGWTGAGAITIKTRRIL